MKYGQLSLSDFDEYYELFAGSIQAQFSEYTQGTIRYFVEKDYTSAWMKGELKVGRKIAFVARENKTIVGYLFVNRVYGGVSTASWLAVPPAFQKRGIATKLLDMWEKYVMDNGGHSLRLWTTGKNLDFYAKRGFIHMGTYPKAWFGVDMPMMYKTLVQPKEDNYLRKYLANES